MWCCDEDAVTTDAVHVDACSSLNIVQVDVAILGDQVNVILWPNLENSNCHLFRPFNAYSITVCRQIFFSDYTPEVESLKAAGPLYQRCRPLRCKIRNGDAIFEEHFVIFRNVLWTKTYYETCHNDYHITHYYERISCE